MLIVTCTTCLFTLASVYADYWNDRTTFITIEEKEMLGSSIILNEKEIAANKILMDYKLNEYDNGLVNPEIFAPARYFLDARQDIENSKVFQFIKRVPKGSALHGHNLAIVSFDYLYNLTYRDHLYACEINNHLKLKFLLNPSEDNACEWKQLKELRNQNPNYDKWIHDQLTLDVKGSKQKYPNVNVVWEAFMEFFSVIHDMIRYRPVFQEYFYQALMELYEDNVMYLEFRTTLPSLYELNGTVYDPLYTPQVFQETLVEFKRNHPNFLGARFIYAPSRNTNDTGAQSYVTITKRLKKAYPDLFAGFDLVGQEDKGRPLVSFISELQEIASYGINFFFHAGETNWFDTSTDFNLVDVILLGTKRIGHAYAMIKHPLVMKKIKEQQIAIEVCPISNQVLKLVDDMRNHPAASLIAQGYPVVVSYDDPSFWCTKGLSYDFYMMFMGIAGKKADLKVIKQLVKNSILFSAMTKEEIVLATNKWEKQWNEFIDDMVT